MSETAQMALHETHEAKMAQDLLAWALGEFHPRIALASSFGAEDVVLIDMLWRLDSRARVFTLDTGRLPAETYALRGYPSIGCAPCTRAVAPGEDLRAGRWWWEESPEGKECGLHPAGHRA
jgi:3'-phosphoadenosine 5'-phosphosulfate sulfotransferase (PAPS reductase)/FAD synthetase